ncbi:hypothetical protein [Nakamurella flava]|uniref:hypothetical protein n=1 Tax=Nakamurella flava TaxID=2576308 RepID=UPI00197B46F8|nr:hypothetical protein [Nakamurella flava]
MGPPPPWSAAAGPSGPADPYGVDQNARTDQYRRPSPAERTRYLPAPDGRSPAAPYPGAQPVGPPESDRTRGSHLPPYNGPTLPSAPGSPGASTDPAATTRVPGGRRASGPRKLTVTRVAAFRSRELTTRGVQLFQRAAAADGADRSGLQALTYATMGNYAVDAALAVALANTLFFAAASAESSGKVLLYLLITVAPFAVIAPLIGPALDRLQHGRRIALAASSFARAVLALIMAFNFDSWVLYPCALGELVLSKSFSVLKSSITPRVLPPDITLVKTNSRLTVFGLLAGGAAGAVAGALAWAFGSTGALVFTAAAAGVGGWLCLRIPAWVESTAGEVPVAGMVTNRRGRAFTRPIVTTLWANGAIRVETGFLALFMAFVIKSEYGGSSGFVQLLLLGVVGVAAGAGGFVGNGLGARLPLSHPEMISFWSLAATLSACVVALLAPGLLTAAIVGLVGATASALAKVCLDSVIQDELPEASRASAFGRSETALQLSWVFGGVVGLLIGGVWSFGHDSVYTIGFAVISVLLAVGVAQSWLVRRGGTLFGWLPTERLRRGLRRTPATAQPDAPTTPRSTDPATRTDPRWGASAAPTWTPPTADRPGAQHASGSTSDWATSWAAGGATDWSSPPPASEWSSPPGWTPPASTAPPPNDVPTRKPRRRPRTQRKS